MESERFDRLARSLTTGSSRRGVVAGLAGSLATTLSLASGGDAKRARKRHKKCRCRPNCKNKVCGDNGCGKSCGTCPADQLFCCNGACRSECCGDAQCATGQTCLRGACVTPCTIDQDCPVSINTCCNGACVNTDTDRNNCGACGTPCSGTATCFDGQCANG
jgi:hypothetical protein